MKKMAEEVMKTTNDVLKPEQVKRLDQIHCNNVVPVPRRRHSEETEADGRAENQTQEDHG